MRVSVCIPTLNRISYLKDALASVAAQSFSDLEVLITDNSADSSYNEKVRTAIAESPVSSCRLFCHPKTISMVDNANFLIDHSRGDYWIYLPDDDRMRPDCLSVLVKALDDNPCAGVAFSDHWIIREDGTVDQAFTAANTRRYQRSKLRSGFIPQENLFPLAMNQSFELQSMLFRHEVISALKFNPDSGNIPDFDLQVRITQAVPPVNAYYCAERLTEYRKHDGQFTTKSDARETYRQMIASLERCTVIPWKFKKQFQRKLAAYHLALALKEAAGGNDSESIYHLRKSFTLNPTIKAYLYSALFQLPSNVLARIQSMVGSLKRLSS